MSRYEPASMRDALALVSALALGDITTAVQLAADHAADPLHPESIIVAPARRRVILRLPCRDGLSMTG